MSAQEILDELQVLCDYRDKGGHILTTNDVRAVLRGEKLCRDCGAQVGKHVPWCDHAEAIILKELDDVTDELRHQFQAALSQDLLRGPMQIVSAESETRCGNPDHPQGAWHPASSLPASWEIAKRWQQRQNTKRWGCGCNG